ncbi:DUF2207 family protein [Streptococcus sp. zg-JUN1979]|uniref:DUF2207 family protein n=1 Tax=Streptococcus sp. zg-JUN1979 TaxID=3391450 RepID=UPI0039A77857
MKKCLGLVLFILTLLVSPTVLADVSYTIPNYQANLVIHKDNTADFTQEITYQFESDYNGQIITLGNQKMPDGFSIDDSPQISVATKRHNQTLTPEITSEIKDLGDGYSLKVYNAGQEDDRVTVRVVWHLKQLLSVYDDVAELNWLPISDWDETLGHVRFVVSTDDATSDSALWGHRGGLYAPLQASKDDNALVLEADNVDGALELHGYIDSNYFLGIRKKTSKQKEAILETESKILRYYQKQVTFYGSKLSVWLLVGIVTLSFALFFYLYRLNRFSHFNKKARLYEPPEDLSPLLLADNLYGVTLSDMSKKTSQVTFDNLVRATLLDLIDRQIITYDGEAKCLSIVHLEAATGSDRDVIDLMFGERKSCLLEDLFSDYQYDFEKELKVLKKRYKGEALRRRVRQSAKGKRQLLSTRQANLERSIQKEIKQGFYPPVYHPLSLSAILVMSSSLLGIFAMSCASVITCVYVFSSSEESYLQAMYLGLTSLGALLSLGLFWLVKKRYDEGVVTKEGRERLYQWRSFSNMLRDIGNFERAELESIVIWNRLLVYATLFGYGDEVEKALKIRGIDLPMALSFDDFTYLSRHLAYGTRQFYASSQAISTATHFTLPSHSGGQGGFSGGGGGGGGGAF